MGDINQLHFIKQHSGIIAGAILEIGSKDYGSTPDFRSVFPDYDYVGIDIEKGKGVDVVLDLTNDFNIVSQKLGGRKFNTVICFSVLEHCKNPFKMCDNISKLLNNNGILFISAPFSWGIHGYPSDYWRFTPDGIKVLLPELDFDTYMGSMATCKAGEAKPLHDSMFCIEWRLKKPNLRRNGYFTGFFIYLCKKLGLLPRVLDYPYLHPPVMVNMIGVKK